MVVLNKTGSIFKSSIKKESPPSFVLFFQLSKYQNVRGEMYVLDIFDRSYFRVILLLLLLQFFFFFFEDNSDVGEKIDVSA